MSYEDAFLKTIQNEPNAVLPRLMYADWLEERGDVRCEFVRLHLALQDLPPDHLHRVSGELDLSQVRKGLDPDWLAVIEPERAYLGRNDPWLILRRLCCVYRGRDKQRWSQPEFHTEPQDTECDAWKRLLELVERTAEDGQEEFAPLEEVSDEDRLRIITLPRTISKLKSVKRLSLYASNLVRIPPEIGEMTSLEEFDPYTSYRLHWFPYEITRCRSLRGSRVSTRALYGNFKYRPPFPRLRPRLLPGDGPSGSAQLLPKRWESEPRRNCSVCNRKFQDAGAHRVWISLRVATDVLPLLVNACSDECVRSLPTPPDRYVQEPHRGGLSVVQPPLDYLR
jgi:uncharacterized protein (TIGR02996 family)